MVLDSIIRQGYRGRRAQSVEIPTFIFFPTFIDLGFHARYYSKHFVHSDLFNLPL
jgi:hypothetical protein